MGADLPDISSLYLEEALDALETRGIRIGHIIKALPPKRDYSQKYKRFRVVSTKRGEDGEVSLIVTPARDVEDFFEPL